MLTPAEVLLAFAAFTKFIPDILAVRAVADKNCDEWRFHEGPLHENRYHMRGTRISDVMEMIENND